MNKRGIKPEDILADNDNFINLNGITARKGSVAAFLKNIDLLEDENISKEEKEGALQMLKELAPTVIATGLCKHASFHNPAVSVILDAAERDLKAK